MGYNGGGKRKVRSSMIPLSRLSLGGGNIGLIIMLIIIPIVIIWGIIEVLVSLFDWISEKNDQKRFSEFSDTSTNYEGLYINQFKRHLNRRDKALSSSYIRYIQTYLDTYIRKNYRINHTTILSIRDVSDLQTISNKLSTDALFLDFDIYHNNKLTESLSAYIIYTQNAVQREKKKAVAIQSDNTIAQVDPIHNTTPQSVDKFAKLEQLLQANIAPFHNKPVEVGIIEKIESTFVFEYQFYFTRALLSIEEYNTHTLGEVFRSTFPTYESYVNEWNSIYWGCSALYKINYVFGIILQEYKLLEEESFYELLLHGVNLVFDDKERLLHDAILGKPYIETDHTAIIQMASWHWYKMLRVGSVMSIDDIAQTLDNSLIKRQEKVLQDGLNKYDRLYSEQYAVIIESFYNGEPYNETISSNSVFTTDVYNSLKANGYIVAMDICVQGYRVDIAIKSRDGKKDIMWVMCETHSFTPDDMAFVANKYKVLALANVKIYKLKSSNWSRYRPSEESNLLKAVENVYK